MDNDFTTSRIPEGTRAPGSKRRLHRDPFAVDLDVEAADVLLRIYTERRLKYQMDYYARRASEYENRADLIYRLGAILMTVSTFLASLGVLADNPIFSLLTAAIPAFVTFINAFSQLYQWDRVAALYRDTILNLEEVKLALPDDDRWSPSTALDMYTQVIAQSEQVFQKEADSWGQLAQGLKEDGSTYDPVQDFVDKYGTSLLDENGQVDMERIGELQHILEASQQAYTPLSVRASQTTTTSSGISSSGELALSIAAESNAQTAEAEDERPMLASGDETAVADDVEDDLPTSAG